MSPLKESVKKIRKPEALRSQKRNLEDHKHHISSEIRGVVSTMQQMREKTRSYDLMNKEEAISSAAAEIRTMLEALKTNIDKDRQTFAEELSKCSKECEVELEEEIAKFQAAYKNFVKEKAAHIQALKDTISKYEEEKERLFIQYEQKRKREKSLIQETENACADKIIKLEESLKKKQDDKAFRLLRKTLGSILETASDEDVSTED